ncbi:MAG: hypothetical protein FWD68_11350 [Alphaproteobacteria bacterium]|nr:hypothetical protein [Alphaproteobacteria bacterium]
MTPEKRALANLAQGLELPLETVEDAAMEPLTEELSEAEIASLSLEFDSYADPVLACYLTVPSPEQVSALQRYVAGGRAALSSEIRALLKTSAGFRATLARMMEEIIGGAASLALAPVAAASDGDLEQRRFAGGMVTMAPAEGHPGQLYVVVDFDAPGPGVRYAILQAEDASDVATLPLEERFDDGVMQVLVDLENPEVACFVRLFRSATSQGALSQ